MAAPAAGLDGSWQAEQSNGGGAPDAATLVFTRNGATLSGVMRGKDGDMPLFDVKEAGSTVSFTLVIPGSPYVSVRYSGALAGDELRLVSSDDGQGVYMLTAHRSGVAPARVAADALTAPAAPAQERAQVATLDAPALRPSQLPPPAPQTAPAPQTPPPAAPPRLVPPAPANIASASGRLDGTWTARQESSGSAAPVEARLTFTGSRGVMHVGADDWPLFEVRDAGAEVSFTLIIPGQPYVTIHYAGRLESGMLQLASVDEGQGVFRLEANRANAPGPGFAAAPVTPVPAPETSTAAANQSRRTPSQATAPAPTPPVVASLTPPPQTPRVAPAPVAPPPEVQPPVREPVPTPPPSSAQSGPVAKLPLPALRDLPPNNLALKPIMGWASRQKLGTDIDNNAIEDAADGLNETGLRAAGFVYVEVDHGWQGERDASGVLHANAKFPDMKALGDFIHGKRLKFGLEVSAAPKSCDGFEGSYGHEAEDAKTFASWGVDYVLYDWCGAEKIYPTQAEQRAAYQKMAEALRATGRDIVFGMSQRGVFDVASWGAKTGANLWLSGFDIKDEWASFTEAGFGQNGKEAFAGPGHWNSPGLLQAGNGGMTSDEYRIQMNLWAILAAPMMLGDEVRIMTRETLGILINEELIEINQDALGRQGKRVSQNGQTEVWARPLADGSTAVAFFNRGDQSAPVAVSWEQLGIEGRRLARDLWWHRDLGNANGRYVVFLTGHTSLLLKLSR